MGCVNGGFTKRILFLSEYLDSSLATLTKEGSRTPRHDLSPLLESHVPLGLFVDFQP